MTKEISIGNNTTVVVDEADGRKVIALQRALQVNSTFREQRLLQVFCIDTCTVERARKTMIHFDYTLKESSVTCPIKVGCTFEKGFNKLEANEMTATNAQVKEWLILRRCFLRSTCGSKRSVPDELVFEKAKSFSKIFPEFVSGERKFALCKILARESVLKYVFQCRRHGSMKPGTSVPGSASEHTLPGRPETNGMSPNLGLATQGYRLPLLRN